MRIQNLMEIPQYCYQAASPIIFLSLEKIKRISISFLQLLNIQKTPSKLKMPLHPFPNPYPRHYKYADWPRYLDKRLGDGEDDNKIERIAKKVEPNELVTPLHVATLRNDLTGIFRFLAHNDADVEDYRGQTPAYWAAYFGHVQALTILKKFKADLNHIDKRGKTPLRAAVKYNKLHVIDFLVSHNVDINIRDGRGLTPIQLAAYRGHVQAYEKLLFYGADELTVDADGKTPRDILTQKCKEKYDNLFFLFKLFSSPTPSFSLRPYNIAKLSAKIKGKKVQLKGHVPKLVKA